MEVRKIINYVKDIIFPVACVECGVEGEWWCEQCLSKIILTPVNRCPVCHDLTAAGSVCAPCRSQSFLDGVAAFFPYDESAPIGRLIKQYKYNYARGIEEVWGKIIAKNVSRSAGSTEVVTIIPIPLHPRRARERGFNQADVLAQFLAERLGCEWDRGSLRRVRYTQQQAHLSGAARQKNIRAAFQWTNTAVTPTSVLLVDDVFTTGATMQECARILKQAGAKKVWGWALARGW